MSNDSQQIVSKAWNFAHVLRDDGLSYMGARSRITFLLFLKMADEQAKLAGAKPSIIPKGKKGERYDWQALLDKDGEALETQHRATLEFLSRQPGMLGEIFKKARPDIYEGPLAKSAAESLKGAGQYFTPRELFPSPMSSRRRSPTTCRPPWSSSRLSLPS